MYFMYVDESGDPGSLKPGGAPALQPSPHYILSGFIIPAQEWRNYLTALVDIRRGLKKKFGLAIRTELHAAQLLTSRGNALYSGLGGRHRRVALYQETLQSVVSRMPQARIINVYLDKANPKYSSTLREKDYQQLAWQRLIQRFDTYLKKSCDGDLGMILGDETNEVLVRRVLRKMRVFNYVPSYFGGSYASPADNIVEDPVMRNSRHSYFVQVADLVSHALYRKLHPKGSYKRYNVDRLFDIVDPVLVKAAAKYDPQGIVRL